MDKIPPVIVQSRLHEADMQGFISFRENAYPQLVIHEHFPPKHPVIEKIEMQQMARVMEDARNMSSYIPKDWLK